MSRISQFIKARPVATATVGVLMVVAGATAVSAQYGPGWGRGQGGHERGGRMTRFCAAEIERYQPVARAWVKADLNLNAGQSGEFDKLADIVAPAMQQIKAEICNNLANSTAPAPEKLEKLAAALRMAADAADKAVGPAKSFYAQLDDKQKARVEEVMERRRHGRMERRWRDHHRSDRSDAAPGGTPPR